MKKILLVLFILLFTAGIAAAEPFITENTDCLAKKNLDIGVQSYYGVDSWKISGVASTDYKVLLVSVSMPLKYGITDKFQFNM